MKWRLSTLCVFVFILLLTVDGRKRRERNIIFPPIAIMGLFLAIAVPIDLPNQNVFVSYNIEGNYHLPYKTTDLGDLTFYAPVTEKARSLKINRKLAYDIIEDKFNKSGLSGKACLLRSICEAAETPLDHQGVLGGMVHVLFTPSTSEDEDLSSSYYLAEKHGYASYCNKYVTQCPTGLLDSISKVVDIGYAKFQSTT